MKLPKPRMLTAAKRQLITTFYGLDRTDRCVEDASDGESYFSDMENGGSDSFPFAASRTGRAVDKSLAEPCNGLFAMDYLAYVDGTKLIYDGEEVLTDLIDGEKRLLAFGAYILVYPDQVYYNTANGESGAMETVETVSGECSANVSEFAFKNGIEKILVTYTGDLPSLSEDSPESVNYEMTSENIIFEEPTVVNTLEIQYKLYTRIINGRLEYLKKATASKVSGAYYEASNRKLENQEWSVLPVTSISTEEEITATGYLWNGDYPVSVSGKTVYLGEVGNLASAFKTYDTFNTKTEFIKTHIDCTYKWTASNLPRLDYVCSIDNRLFGCRYGAQAGSTAPVNMLYASALGDFKAWEQFQGISTDSWYAHCGESGPFTGACTYNGHPMFFKEDCAYIISGSYPPYSYTVLNIDGVALGASRSLCEVDGALYYKSRNAVMRYTSSSLGSISDRLGRLPDAVKAAAGGYSGKYYLSLEGTVYVYDTKRGIWCKEDACGAVDFAVCGGELYIASSKADASVADADATYPIFRVDGATPTNHDAAWSLTTPIIGYGLPNRKYVSKVLIRMELGDDELPKVELSRDGGAWEALPCSAYRNAADERTGSMTIPIRPRRCETFRIRLSGKGAFKLTGITKQIEEGGR